MKPAAAGPPRCLCCGRPVELVAGSRHLCLLEVDAGDGCRRPHACPPEAISRFAFREGFRRVSERRRAALRPHRSIHAPPLPDVTGPTMSTEEQSPQELKEV